MWRAPGWLPSSAIKQGRFWWLWVHFHYKCGKCRKFCKRIMGQTPSTEDVNPKLLLVSRTVTLEKSYPSTQFLHRQQTLSQQMNSTLLQKFLLLPIFLHTRYYTSSDFSRLKVDDTGGFSWTIFWVRHKRDLSFLSNSWKQEYIQSAEEYSLICLYLNSLHCEVKAHSLCMKRFGLHSLFWTFVSQWIIKSFRLGKKFRSLSSRNNPTSKSTTKHLFLAYI